MERQTKDVTAKIIDREGSECDHRLGTRHHLQDGQPATDTVHEGGEAGEVRSGDSRCMAETAHSHADTAGQALICS